MRGAAIARPGAGRGGAARDGASLAGGARPPCAAAGAGRFGRIWDGPERPPAGGLICDGGLAFAGVPRNCMGFVRNCKLVVYHGAIVVTLSIHP